MVAQIQSIAGKTEEELKSLTNTYTEKNLALTAAKRRQVINLTSSELEDFLTPEIIAKIDAQNTETLLTVLVVVPKNAEQGNDFFSMLSFLFEITQFLFFFICRIFNFLF